MSEALRLAREYGVGVRFVDLGDWGESELRAEYDPAVPEIRINRRIVEALLGVERERFVALAIGHELYHHLEHLREIPTLAIRGERESAADEYAVALLDSSTGEPQKAIRGEVYWKYSKIREALKNRAAARRVILGFDIVEFVNGASHLWGASSYSLDGELRARSWNECVARGLELSLHDVDRTRQLTGLEPPFDDLWFTIVDISSREARNGNYRRLSNFAETS